MTNELINLINRNPYVPRRTLGWLIHLHLIVSQLHVVCMVQYGLAGRQKSTYRSTG
jgi:hypothetical protein